MAEKKECKGRELYIAGVESLEDCAKRCQTVSTMFAYGTNDFGLERCYDQKCKCVCEPTASAEGTCKTKAHNGYRLYRYV